MKEMIKVGAVIEVKKSSDEIPERNQAAEPMLIEISPTAKTNLKKLRLVSLDRQGRQPEPSQIIEKLIDAAAVSGPDAPSSGVIERFMNSSYRLFTPTGHVRGDLCIG